MELNKKYITYNLQEAHEEIEIILRGLKKTHYSHEQLYSSMQHLIHHVNIAWNSRNTTWEEVENVIEDDVIKWSQTPKDINLI